MITEIFNLLGSMDVTKKGFNKKFSSEISKNLSNSRIRSISAFSANSIFYFPEILSNQITPEESAMVKRMIEKSAASFVVACISLMPFHRISSDDKDSIEDYLSQFHQNLGIGQGSTQMINKLVSMNLTESADNTTMKDTQDFLMECWNRSVKEDQDFLKIVSETVSLNDMYKVDPIDPKTKLMAARFNEVQTELNTWGFIGEATDNMFDDDDDDQMSDSDYDDFTDYGDEDFESMSDEELMSDLSVAVSDQDIEDEFPGLSAIIDERALTAKARKELPDDVFGIPKKRAFPLNDARHVEQAIRMFSHASESERPGLAKKIFAAVDKFNVDVKVGKDNPLYEYTPKNLQESAVKSAIDSIKFSLESVSENKILSANSLTRLANLESKLKTLKNKYTKYLNRYKKKYKENQKSGSKSKLAIRFNKMTIDNPKVFMQQYGDYIKIINRRLKAVEKRRAELLKRKGKPVEKLEESITSMDFDTLDYCIRSIDESINASDNDVFILTESKSDIKDLQKRLDDQEARLKDNTKTMRYEQNKSASLTKEAQKNASRADKAERERDLYKSGYDRLKNQPANTSNAKTPEGKASSNFSTKTFDREVFTNMDMKKANEAVPTFAKATINFIVDDTNEVVTRDIMIGVKAYIHVAPSMELVDDVYNSIINKRKFLRFVKFITGEEKSLADLMFGIKELRNDAIDAKTDSGEWRSAFKRRKRWSKISIPYLMKEYTPNGTVVMTMNEVEFIKDHYGIDIMTPDHINMIMESDFLLSFVILDQSNEIVYVTYDGHNGTMEQYTYAMLEREQQTSDRMMRELYRSFSR